MVQEYINFPGGAFLKFRKNTYDFLGGKNTVRKDQIFQESFLKIVQKHIIFQEEKYHKNRSKFPAELS